MGWTWMHRAKGYSTFDFFRTHGGVDGENEHAKWELLKSANVGTTVYMAVKITPKGSERLRESASERFELNDDGSYVVAYIFLTARKSRPADGYNFGWKDMDESVLPYECSCPKSIMRLLSPLKKGYEGNEAKWRENVAKYHQRMDTIKSLTDGTVIKIAEPIRFSDGVYRQTFKVTRPTSRKIQLFAEGGIPVRMTLEDREFEIVSDN